MKDTLGRVADIGVEDVERVADPGHTGMAHLVKDARARLKRRGREELARGTTLSGPHRDDLGISLDGKSARAFASQGQQRTAALALKMAELGFLRARMGESPVLLLDDVLSELDQSRRRRLLGLLDGQVQTFITTTDPEDFELEPGQCLEIREGSLLEKSRK